MKKNYLISGMRSCITLILIGFNYGMVYSQNVEVKDTDDNVLMRVEDEGSSGSVYLGLGGTPSNFTHKLYNVSGSPHHRRTYV